MLWIALFCVTAGLYWLWNHHNSKPDEPPYLPGAWPILGHIPRLRAVRDACQLWTVAKSIFEETLSLGGVAQFKMGPKTVYLVANPSDVVTVANACLDKISLYDFFKPCAGDSLFTSNGSRWKNQRKLLNPAFSQSVLNIFIDVFNVQGRKCVKDLRKEAGNGYFDHSLYTTMITMETVGRTSLGADFGDSELKKTYIKNMDLFFHYIIKRMMKPWLYATQIFRFSTLQKKQDDCIKFCHEVSNSVLLRKKAELKENIHARDSSTQGQQENSIGFDSLASESDIIYIETNREDSKISYSIALYYSRATPTTGNKIITGMIFHFISGTNKTYMDILLELSQQGVLNDREVREHIDTIIIAGTDSSATALTFILLLLGAHPAVQEKTFAELKEVFGDEDRDVEKKDLSQLIYLDAVIKESLRLYPVAPVIGRQIDKDVKLKNCTLYAGHMCVLILYAVHTHPSWGPDRYEFRPERWLDPSQLPDNGFAAFSFGRRMCIGKGYTFLFMKTILIHLLRHYKITADDSQLKLRFDILLKAKSGYFISVEERTSL